MNSEGPTTPIEAEVEKARSSQQVVNLRTRLLGAGVLVFVVVATFQAHPAPGGRGKSLGVAIALILFSAATVGVIRLPEVKPAVQLPLLLVGVLASAMLIELQQRPGIPGGVPCGQRSRPATPRSPEHSRGCRCPCRNRAGRAGRWALGAHGHGAGRVRGGRLLLAGWVRPPASGKQRPRPAPACRVAQTRAAQAQAAALGERQRLAREMHDVLAHSLSGLVLNLEGARLIADRDGAVPAVADAIERARRLAKGGLEEARRAIAMLRDEALPGPERLHDLASEFEADSGAACILSITGDERDLGSEARFTLYRVAQEALTNVRKHAHPERVELRLTYEPSGMRLTVEDFEALGERPPPGDGSGYGLSGMQERAELIGGSLTAGPTEGGFRVELWVPT